MGRAFCAILILLALTAGGPAAAAPSGSADEPSDIARNYLDEAIGQLRKLHINRERVDWDAVRADALKAAKGARAPADVYPAIRLVIDRLGERHTFLIPATAARDIEAGAPAGKPRIDLPEAERLASGATMIRLTNFVGSTAEGRQYAETGRALIAAAQARSTCGYILDLRFNGGGDMWPMLNALLAMLPQGLLGTFETATGRDRWSRTGRFVAEENDAEGRSFAARRVVPFIAAPVAVLVGPGTKSSGEFTAISLEGRPRTRFFGQPTGGYVTVNETVTLSDGAELAISTGWAKDRNGRAYKKNVVPDVVTQGGQPTIDAAHAWLARQGCPPVSTRRR